MLLQRAKGYSHVVGDALERFLARTYRGKNIAFAWGKAVSLRECRKVLVGSAIIGGGLASGSSWGLAVFVCAAVSPASFKASISAL